MKRILIVAGIFLSALVSAHAADLNSNPRILDGDTVQIGDVKIRLNGIDAPETDQICLDKAGQRWTCGLAARDAPPSNSRLDDI